MKEPATNVQRFEPYGVPTPSIATVCREVDDTASEVIRLRREKALALQAAEAERVESARLRAQNLELANALAAARGTTR